jgi:hypothetical protein
MMPLRLKEHQENPKKNNSDFLCGLKHKNAAKTLRSKKKNLFQGFLEFFVP